MGLREKQKEKRREQILDAARRLIRATGGTDFPMRVLAEEAEVSLVTPYNLFRSKSGVLYALLNDSLEGLAAARDEQADAKAVDSVLDLAGVAAKVYSRDAAFYRPLMRFLLGVPDPEHRPRLLEQSLQRWRHTVEVAVSDGLLIAGSDVELLARQLLISFMGVVELWIHDELNEDDFLAQSLYGSTLVVLVYATDTARPSLRERLESLARRLPRQLPTSNERQSPPENSGSQAA